MVVVGIDTNSFGFHAVSSESISMPPTGERAPYGWALSQARESDERLQAVFGIARGFFASLPEDTHVFCEEPLILPKNIQTTRKLVMMGGVLYAAFIEANPDAFWYWVDVSTWRRIVINPPKGQYPRKKDEWKAAAKAWCQTHALGWHAEIEALYDSQPDLYDAHCLMAYGWKKKT